MSADVDILNQRFVAIRKVFFTISIRDFRIIQYELHSQFLVFEIELILFENEQNAMVNHTDNRFGFNFFLAIFLNESLLKLSEIRNQFMEHCRCRLRNRELGECIFESPRDIILLKVLACKF